MSHSIDTAMILAAGLGTRMRPLTEHTPKPLIEVGGKPLIDYGRDAARAAGITRFVVNVHHLADRMERHLATWGDAEVLVSDERDRLRDSGGGVVHALPKIARDRFLILNADTFWQDEPASQPNLEAMLEAFDPARMDLLLLLVPPARTTGHEARNPQMKGDFTMAPDGRLARYRPGDEDPLIYAGAIVASVSIFEDCPREPFSLNRCFDAALAVGRLAGFVLDGHWITVGTPAAIVEAERALAGARPAA
jgi:MurNAc alpha-1-phosphate uridylyltransferase